MVNPVQLNGSQNVYFRANEDLINSPGAFQQPAPEIPADSVELSGKKKGGFGRFIGKLLLTVAVASAALWGLFKGKGEKWIVENPKGLMAKIKKWSVTPGEWIDRNAKNLINKIKNRKLAKSATSATGAEA